MLDIHSNYAIIAKCSGRSLITVKRCRNRSSPCQRGLLARYLRYAERMEAYGPDLGMPHTRAMGDGLFELRLKAGEGIGRVFYCTLIGRRIVMLHQFVKKSEKTPLRELDVARRRMKEVKDADA